MPLYDFECAQCGRMSEHLLSREELPAACPNCGAEGTLAKTTIPAKSSFQLRGGGWFKDGYSKPQGNQ